MYGSSLAKKGSLFLFTIPKCKEHKFTSDQLMIIPRFRYFIPITSYVLNTRNPVQCNCSNHTIFDQQGIHITRDHKRLSIMPDKLVHTLNQFIRFAGHRTTVEPKGCFSLYSDTNVRPDISQETILIDVSLTSPITSDNNGRLILKTGTPISSTSIKSHAASLRFKDKHNKYEKIIY